MPELSRFFGLVIRMYYNDHAPPHFHAEYGEHEVLVDIRTLETIGGSLPKRGMALVLEWAAVHRHELMQDWNRAREKKPLRAIAPLE